MMIGLGSQPTQLTGTVNTSTVAALPGFMDGLKLWTSPGTAVTVLTAAASNPSAAFGATAMPFTAGILALPLGAVLLFMTFGGKRR